MYLCYDTMKNKTAYEYGYEDGFDWDLSGFKSREQITTNGWDEATINAVGSDQFSEIYGINLYDSDGWLTEEASNWLHEYNRGAADGARQQWDNNTSTSEESAPK